MLQDPEVSEEDNLQNFCLLCEEKGGDYGVKENISWIYNYRAWNN